MKALRLEKAGDCAHGRPAYPTECMHTLQCTLSHRIYVHIAVKFIPQSVCTHPSQLYPTEWTNVVDSLIWKSRTHNNDLWLFYTKKNNYIWIMQGAELHQTLYSWLKEVVVYGELSAASCLPLDRTAFTFQLARTFVCQTSSCIAYLRGTRFSYASSDTIRGQFR